MSAHRPNYPKYSRNRVGSSVRKTQNSDYKKDIETGRPYANYHPPNLRNQIAANQISQPLYADQDREIHSKEAIPWIYQVSFNGYVMISFM